MQKMGTMEERETERKRDGDTHTYTQVPLGSTFTSTDI